MGDICGIKNYRLVGRILAKNPTPGKIPCHRVVCSDGKIGGYSLGIKKKILLLLKERVKIKNNKIINLKKIIWPKGKINEDNC